MKYMGKELSIEELLNKEWIITNGLGGYASSSIIGANTRRYHGLLVSPLVPPARRHLVLSKIDEAITINNKSFPLYTNICRDYISEGYKYQESFRKKYIPIFTYKVEDIEVTKMICMEYRKNTVAILYKIKGGKKDCKLTLTPIVNFRDFHTLSENKGFVIKQNNINNKVRIIVDNNGQTPIYIKCSDGIYKEYSNNTFNNMMYIEEEKRGFNFLENHAVVGSFEIPINKESEKEVSVICSLEDNIDEKDAKQIVNDEIKRLESIVYESNILWKYKSEEEQKQKDFVKDLILASDDFVVYRPNFGLHTIIAGYHWFLDWGRDALISFEGLLLKTRRFDIAKEVLLTFIRDIKYGLVPNGYSGYDNRPLYNSADSSLLLFEATNKYLSYTGDFVFVRNELYDVMKKIIKSYIEGIDLDNNNIYLDKDYLIVSGTENTQNTWMDAKCDGKSVTPRNGKAVEINALFYNALKVLEKLCEKFGEKTDSEKYLELSEKVKKSFLVKMYNEETKYLYDVLGDKKIRPNALFALSLSYPILDVSSIEAKNILKTVDAKLLNNYGLKSLAKNEEGYIEVYEGNYIKRDNAYHQGITWVWLLGLYSDSLINCIRFSKTKKEKKELKEKYLDFANKIEKTFMKELYERGAVYSISEIYDSKKPNLPKGAIAQAWSMSEILKIMINKKDVENDNIRD